MYNVQCVLHMCLYSTIIDSWRHQSLIICLVVFVLSVVEDSVPLSGVFCVLDLVGWLYLGLQPEGDSIGENKSASQVLTSNGDDDHDQSTNYHDTYSRPPCPNFLPIICWVFGGNACSGLSEN